MKTLDRILQTWRIKVAAKYLSREEKVLDVGTHDGALFQYAGGAGSVGIDPNLVEVITGTPASFVRGYFPADLPAEHTSDKLFDAIVILAVIEHLDAEVQQQLARDCFQFLNAGGRVIVTTPSPLVDTILDVLFFLKIIDGMGGTHEDHYGFEPADTIPVFEQAGFETEKVGRFQLGLNNLFVFRKPNA